MKNKLKQIVLGNFLIDEGSFRKWRYVIFLFSMCLIMIYSSHLVDSKIIKISELKNETSVLKSDFIEGRKKVMKLKMESNVTELMFERQIKSSTIPPKKIVIE
jgi:hypothetical protein